MMNIRRPPSTYIYHDHNDHFEMVGLLLLVFYNDFPSSHIENINICLPIFATTTPFLRSRAPLGDPTTRLGNPALLPHPSLYLNDDRDISAYSILRKTLVIALETWCVFSRVQKKNTGIDA